MKQLVVDQSTGSDWGHLRITGADRVRFMQGMCSANIEALAEGEWCRAVMLNVKGRVTSVIELAHMGTALQLWCLAEHLEGTRDILQKYAVVDDVEFETVECAMHRIWASPSSVWSAPPIWQPAPEPVASPAECEVRRVEAGLPRYGVDVDDQHFPFESLLAQHLDYEKGCYIGQEPVYRVHAKGNPNKKMMGIRLSDLVARGAVVSHRDRAAAGTVTSSVQSPDFGAIALAYIHRSVAEVGAEVVVGDGPGRLVDLPFAD